MVQEQEMFKKDVRYMTKYILSILLVVFLQSAFGQTIPTLPQKEKEVKPKTKTSKVSVKSKTIIKTKIVYVDRPIDTEKVVTKESTDCNLFPLFGIMLGKTSIGELANLGVKSTLINSRTSEPYEYYIIEGFDFWYDNVTADHMYITKHDSAGMPKKWEDECGFKWDLSYNDWKELLENKGYSIEINQYPAQKLYSERQTLSAKFTAVKKIKSVITIALVFNFNYGEASTVYDKNTLYSITINKI